MIKTLKIKFISLCMTAVFFLLTFIVTGMNIINYNSVVSEADTILSVLSQNRGAFPEFDEKPEHRLPPTISPELPYESRYFSVLINNEGEVIHTDTSKIASVNNETAVSYAKNALDKDKGFIDTFRYKKSPEMSGLRITFLDCGRKLDSFKNFLSASLIMASAGLLLVFITIFFLSDKILMPITESYKKQKRFITDAGHEIKTPLTIINANIDVLKMDIGENECLDDIKLQTQRLTKLTNDLILLAKSEESENSLQMIDFPLSEVVCNIANQFKTPSKAQQKTLNINIQPLLSMKGNSKSIEQLVSILLDNAVKYTPTNGVIDIYLSKQAKNVALTVTNTTKEEIQQNNLNRLFDRFYRADDSRNSETGGHGIGLSVAKSIVTAHGGKIRAFKAESHTFSITVSFPI